MVYGTSYINITVTLLCLHESFIHSLVYITMQFVIGTSAWYGRDEIVQYNVQEVKRGPNGNIYVTL